MTEPAQIPAGKFLGNRKLKNAEARAFFTSEDPANPSGHEPDWQRVVPGPPQASDPASLEQLIADGYIGLYIRTDDSEPGAPADDHPCRATSKVIQLLIDTSLESLCRRGIESKDAQDFSNQVTEILATAILGKQNTQSQT